VECTGRQSKNGGGYGGYADVKVWVVARMSSSWL
jgi:hypothetical protein